MVDTCQEKISIPASFFLSVKIKKFISLFKFYCQGRDHHVSTVDQSDIRGLVTA